MKPIAVLALALVVLALPPAAESKPIRIDGSTRATNAGTLPGDGRLLTDGRRFVVTYRHDGTLRIEDDATGAARSVATSCRPLAGAYAVFLLACDDTYVGTHLLSARTGAIRPLPGRGPNDRLGGIGRYWTTGDTLHPERDPNSPDYAATAYVNWRTGERREYPQPNGYVTPRDLDSPDLAEPRPAWVRGELGYLYEGPFVVRQRYPRGLVLFEGGRRTALLSTRATVVAEHDSVVDLAAGRVVWIEPDGRIRGYASNDRTRAAWRASGVPRRCYGSEPCSIALRHTRHAVYFSVLTGTTSVYAEGIGRSVDVPSGYRVLAAPWPR